MEILRTANAGVLLKLDGKTILLDGVCREVKPYPATPPELREKLLQELPDCVCFTHAHKDHYDPAYAAAYTRKTGRKVMTPEHAEQLTLDGVTVTAIPSRHIGAAGKTTPHVSYLIQGSRCVWFLGDSSPLIWKGRGLPKPDVLIVPYAYTATATGWQITKDLGATHTILLHMPQTDPDDMGLWAAVRATVGENCGLLIPDMGEQLHLL